MDPKTLAYMGTRVDKARSLDQQIKRCATMLDQLGNGCRLDVIAHNPRCPDMWISGSDNVPDSQLRAAVPTATVEHLAALRKELEEI